MTGVSMQMVFSPQRCTLERLDATLTESRRDLAERLLRRYTAIAEQGGSHHTMLVGPRGSGKSHVLTYVSKKLLGDDATGSTPAIIMLPEEERRIARPFDFVLALLRTMKIPEDAIRARVRGTDRESLMAEATSMLDEKLSGRQAVILSENLNDIFDALGSDALPRLRAFFQEHANISMLGTTTVLWSDSDRPDHPFYGFFEIVSLQELTRQEAHRYLRALAKTDGNESLWRALASEMGKARVKAIYHLTGGNPRLLTMLSAFLTADNLDKLVAPFVQMADRELTPYYQQRLDRLSPTQCKVAMLLTDTPTPQTVTEIMERGYLQQQITSRALNDLLQTGLVNRHRRGREIYYELREPLLRLVLDLKVSGEKPLGMIVNLLRLWYDDEELRSLESNAPPRAKEYLRAALDETIDDVDLLGSINLPALRVAGTAEVIKRQVVHPMPPVLTDGVNALLGGDLEEAVSNSERVITACHQQDGPEHRIYVALAQAVKTLALAQQGRAEDELKAFADLRKTITNDNIAELQGLQTVALVGHGFMLLQLGRFDDALNAFDEVERQLGTYVGENFQHLTATNLTAKGLVLGQLGQAEDALAMYTEVERRFERSEDTHLQVVVAGAMLNKGIVLMQLGRPENALAAFAELEERFVASKQQELQKILAMSFAGRGMILKYLGRASDAAAVYTELERRFESTDQGDLQELVARTLTDKASALLQAGRTAEANDTYQRVVDKYGACQNESLRHICANALAAEAQIALVAKDYVAAMEFCRQSIEFSPNFAKALGLYIEALFSVGRSSAAIKTLGKFLNVTRSGDELRPLAAARLIRLLHTTPTELKKIVRHFHDDNSLVQGLTMWVGLQFPISRETAKNLESADSILSELFADIEAAQLPLKMLNVARRDVLGDTEALLELPLELRQLIKPEPERAHDEGEPEQ